MFMIYSLVNLWLSFVSIKDAVLVLWIGFVVVVFAVCIETVLDFRVSFFFG